MSPSRLQRSFASTTLILALASFFHLSSGHVKRNLQDIHAEYDYVIVGGGTSGLVVANRLSEASNSTIHASPSA
jgi:hypothetical protein